MEGSLPERIWSVFYHGDLCSDGLLMKGAPLSQQKNSPFGEFFFKGAIRIRS